MAAAAEEKAAQEAAIAAAAEQKAAQETRYLASVYVVNRHEEVDSIRHSVSQNIA